MEATAANLAYVGLPKLIEAQAAVRDALVAQPGPARFGASIVASYMAFIPVIDGDLIPAHPLAAIAAGAGGSVPLLTGTTSEEYRLFVVPSGMAALINDDLLAGLLAAMGISARVAELYRSNRPGPTPGDLLAALLTDRFFRLPALAVAGARKGGRAPTYVYEFAWQSPVGRLGACHPLEIPFVSDLTGSSGSRRWPSPGPARAAGPRPTSMSSHGRAPSAAWARATRWKFRSSSTICARPELSYSSATTARKRWPTRCTRPGSDSPARQTRAGVLSMTSIRSGSSMRAKAPWNWTRAPMSGGSDRRPDPGACSRR